MKLKDIVSQLANRINQPNVIEVYLRQVYAKGFMEGTKQSSWISVKDELPEEDCWVLAMGGSPTYRVLFYHEGKFYSGIRYGTYVGSVSHWMLIPNLTNKRK